MEKRITYGKRIITVQCSDRCNPTIFRKFLKMLRKRTLRPHLVALLEKYDVPYHIIVHFRQGKGDLYGQYFVYDQAVAEHLAIIEIYTKPFEDGMQIYPDYDLDFNLLDTFAHELIHHMRAGERQTKKETRVFMAKVADLL